MKNENYVFITELLDSLERIKTFLMLLKAQQQQRCRHFYYDEETFESYCSVHGEPCCESCDDFNPKEKETSRE